MMKRVKNVIKQLKGVRIIKDDVKDGGKKALTVVAMGVALSLLMIFGRRIMVTRGKLEGCGGSQRGRGIREDK